MLKGKEYFKSILRNQLNLEIVKVISDKHLAQLYSRYKEYTMISKTSYINNLLLIEKFSKSNGAVVECGVWRGGMIAGMASILGRNRTYHLFDSFEGLPDVQKIDGEAARIWQEDVTSPTYFDNCKAEEGYAVRLMENLKVPFKVHKGWFSETMKNLNSFDEIDVLRLDADWYDSTIQCLSALFPHVRKGGIILIDDYYTWEGCSKAVHDYLSNEKSSARIFSGKGFAYILK